MLIDYHIHNHFSPDSNSTTKAIVEESLKKNLSAIAITNHSEMFEEDEGEPGKVILEKDLKRFQEAQIEIEIFQKKYPMLQIGFGGEIQYDEDNMEVITELVRRTPFDFTLGSVHNLDNINISGHKFAQLFFENKTEKKAYTKYFENILKLVEWGQFNIVAHFDIIKKFGHLAYGSFKPENHKEILMRILNVMRQKGIGLELNTGSMHKRCKELFPHPDILKWAVKSGIEHFTFGSDAHEIEGIAQYFDEALNIAKTVGITHLSTYKNGQPTKQKL